MLPAFSWLLFNVLSIAALSFYSMAEMACVSFNKIRLDYYVRSGNKRAAWLSKLLKNPSRLFGTTLIGVNIATVVGSECAREFYHALGFNPSLAPLSQVVIVIIFGELAPMFAARHYSEHVAMLTAPLVYASSIILSPFIWAIGFLSKISNKIFGGKEEASDIFLNREELQKMLEEQENRIEGRSSYEEFNAVSSNIFAIRGKIALHIMQPLYSVLCLPSNATVLQLRNTLRKHPETTALVYHKNVHHIVGSIHPRDVVRLADNKRITEGAQPPWFITAHLHINKILEQFRQSSQNIAVVLNEQGKAIGVVTVEDLMAEIFGKLQDYNVPTSAQKQMVVVERTFSGDTNMADFVREFGLDVTVDPDTTLAEYIVEELDHHPNVGESIHIGNFEITVKETFLLEIKTVTVTSRIKKLTTE